MPKLIRDEIASDLPFAKDLDFPPLLRKAYADGFWKRRGKRFLL